MIVMSDQQQQKKQQVHDADLNDEEDTKIQEPVEEAAGALSDDDNEVDDVMDNQVAAVSRKTPVETTSTYNTYDVLLGRGRAYQLYPGNRRFHAMINSSADRYAVSSIQSGKWKITMEIVEAVLAKGRFLKANKHHGWTVIPIEAARQKVAHALQYQNRRMSNKERKKAATDRPSSPKDEIRPAEPTAAEAELVVDDSDTEHDMSAYPNISRVYFSAATSNQKDSSHPFTSRSATEKFLHGMVAETVPIRPTELRPTQTLTGYVATATTTQPSHKRYGGVPLPPPQHDQTHRPRSIVVTNAATNSANSTVDQANPEGQKLSFSGFRRLPFYSAAAAAASAAATHNMERPSCEAKHDSINPAPTAVPTAAPATRRMSNIEEVQQEWSREADTSSFDPLSVDAESTEVADFSHTFHTPHTGRQNLRSSPSYSWNHHIHEAEQMLVALCAETDSSETEQPSLAAAAWRPNETKRHLPDEPSMPPPAPPPDAPPFNTNTRPSVFFPIEETNRVGNEQQNLSSLDLYDLLEEDFRREQQQQQKHADAEEPNPPFSDR